ncbi:non-ribosomal peptide synthetase/type I polyketide synthase [Micromonospora carbonacea]|uniref:Amino acid adenylation domain-containing protein/natural product biosynthesis luciferase-like monooxygenase domain-containing protein n=1 Tax=Micromonospora carbonacea TaxID=47853 RepID=A0A1C5AYF2_9ACTN|nr:non-ribosomal peptide synthetase/type I polyketide synthase [Micromonospora carbonacea]SCF50255.1 amino acid adenylation domain-containing protein/natural product biosynthesis luciferase-like monooxygenase domain-containing protein [Micromonospora carbonacea]
MTTASPPARRPAVSHGGELPADPQHPRTLGAALRRAARDFPDAGIRVVAEDGTDTLLDHATLLTRARAVRAGLRARGVAPGSAAILRVDSGVDYWPAFWGCALGGVVPLTVGAPAGYDADSPAVAALLHAWRALDAPVVLAGAADAAGLAGLPLADRVVDVAELAAAGPAGAAAGRAAPDPAGASADADVEPCPDEVAVLQLSSGSTGTPKIIPLTHRGLSEYAVGARVLLDVRPGDVLLNWLPLDHVAGLLLYHLGGVFLGASSVHVATGLVLADPTRWLDLMARHGVTHGWSPNFGLRLVADAVGRDPGGRRWELGGVRRMVSGGEQCLPETFRAFVAATGVPAAAMTPAWGMSETSTGITFGSFTEPGCRQVVRTASLDGDVEWVEDAAGGDVTELLSVGRPAPGATLRIVDVGGAVQPEGRVGRVQVRSARVTPGYLGDPEATRAAFPDGDWLDTGDLGYLRDGALTVTGRAKDLLILNGQNIPCHEIERVVGAVAGVRSGLVAAVGVPDARTGTEALVVFAVTDAEGGHAVAPADPHATTGSAAERVAGAVSAAVARRWQLAPRRVVILGEADFPRTTGGKIRRAELRRRFLADGFPPPVRPGDAAADGPGAAPVAPGRAAVRAVVRAALADVLGRPAETDRPFYELGVGSVEIVALRARLEEALGRPVPQPALFAHPTVDALAAHLAAGPAPAGGEAAARPADRRVAVVGMAARFPGAADVDEFWAALLAGVESVRAFTPAELAAAGVPEHLAVDPGYVAASGVLDDVAGFDAAFFGVSPREAELLDPQHRLFLETCQHALEDAGCPGEAAGRRIGVFAGGGMNLYPHHTYLRHQLPQAVASAEPATAIGAALGNQPDFLATRVAYRLGLTGPAVTVQTACSTSLVAVHLAARALLAGDADVAVAGAVAVHVPQVTGYRHTPGSILSASGRCRPFDADADGTVGGNGVAAVVLKPLDRALADGDRIHAVLLGSAVNNDGAGKVGWTAPGVAGQVDVVRRALRDAGVPAASVGYVEAHGTGTALGDPVEHHALAEAYAPARAFLGSVKANIGHLDSCAGMAGLIKAVLAVRSGRVPPQINFARPNPALRLADGPFTVTTVAADWPATGAPRRAAVSALGVGGTNAHVVVEQPPPPPPRAAAPPDAVPGLLPVSAADPAALAALALRHRDRLRADPDLALADVVRTAGTGRRHLRHRLVVLGGSTAALAEALDRHAAGLPADVLTGEAGGDAAGPVALAFPGQGDVGDALLPLAARFPVVRAVLDEAAAAYREAVGGDLVARLRADRPAVARPTDVAQPALVVAGVALARLWRSWGLSVGHVLGHSVGEYAALVVAGALPLADAVRLAAHRGRLMADHLPPGAMLAVLADRPTVDALAAGSPLELAAVNGPRQHVLAGPPDAVAAVADRAARLGVATRRLPVDRAFHSAAVAPVLGPLRELAATVEFRPTRLPLVSALDGRVRPPGWRPDAAHLCRHAREPVRWHDAVSTLSAEAVATVVEVGAGGLLTALAGATGAAPGATGAGPRWVPSQRRGLDPVAGLWRAVAELHVAGTPVDWAALVDGHGGRRVTLPSYPFQRRPFWATPEPAAAPAPVVSPAPAASPAPAGDRRADAVPAASPAGPAGGADAVLERVRALTAERLGLAAAEVDPDAGFFALGADSLLLITMSREIERDFAVRVPVRDLFTTVDTPRRLARAITAAAPPTGPDATASAVSPPATDGGPSGDARRPAPGELVDVVRQQLDLMRQQLALLGVAAGLPADPPAAPPRPVYAPPTPAPTPAPPAPAPVPAPVSGPAPAAAPAVADPRPAAGAATTPDTVDFSLYFFGDYPDQDRDDKYGVIVDAAEFADAHGFHAVWLPERHFHSFGGLFPNPSVLAAALATRTRRVRLNAGSVVLPLHHPVRVAEEWSMVDNLSGGRIGLGCAPGWHANDFVFHPEHFGRHKQVMYEHLETVRRLWRGDAVPARSGSGEALDVRLFPRPVQPEPPVFTAIVGNPDSYREAARRDVGVVTNLMTQDVASLAENVALYRRTRAEHGLDPAGGRVVVLLHTYLGEDADRARAEAFEPFCAYLRSSFSLLGQVVNSLGMNIDLAGTPDEDVRFVLGRAYERYCAQRALIGSPQSCRSVVEAVLDAGADEIACFVDFGLPADAVRAGLPVLDALRRATPRRPVGDPPHPGGRTAPLSSAQRRLWLMERLHPGTPAYNEAAAVRLVGPLDHAALRGALRDVVDRHAPLRTHYAEVAGAPRQVVRDRVPVELPVREHTGGAEDEAVRAALAAESRRVFDLAAGPVFAFTLLRFSATRHVLVLAFHHLATDGGSYAVLTDEVSARYRARVTGVAAELPPLPVTYPELAAAGDGEPDDKDLAYWRAQLDPAPPTLVLPSDLARPALPSAAGESVFRELPAELARRVRRFSRAEGVTPFTTLLSAFGVLLSRFTGQDDLVVGTGTSGRDERTAGLVGFFVRTLPLRLDLTGDPSFRELLARVRVTAADGYEHDRVPFDALVEAVAPHREAGRHPLFDVVVEYESGPGAFAFDLPGVTAEPLPLGLAKAPVDLMVYLSHGETLRCHVEYRTDVLDRATVDRLLDHLHRLLDVLTRAPGEPLSRLAARLDDPAARPVGPRPAPAADRLHDLFLRQAERTPDAVAVVDGERRWTYRELRDRARALARRVAAHGVGPDDLVAVLLPRRAELVAAQLGALLAGAAFLPLDPDLPAARLRDLLADSDARLLLTAADVADPFPATGSGVGGPAPGAAGSGAVRVARVLVDRPGDPGLPDPVDAAGPRHLAWCVHTSGSTGRPRLVGVPHRAAVDVVDWHVRALALTGADTVAHALGLGFDANLAEIHPTLAAGATLHLVPSRVRADPARLVDRWRRAGVTVAYLPAPLAELVFAVPPAPAVRVLVVGGSQLRRRPPAGYPAEVLDAYGPTEAAIVTTAGPVPPAGTGPIDIGRPVDHRRLYVLGRDGTPVPAGAVGELHVGGTGLARGYLGRPGATAAVFLPDPNAAEPGARMYRTGDLVRLRGDGTVEFRGRVDDQVKIAGHRVEPGEAAAALALLPGVRQAAVVARHDRAEPYLVGYVVPDTADGPDTDTADAGTGAGGGAGPPDARTARLAAELGERLPAHLVPRAWVVLDALPVGDTGKVDVSRLPAPAAPPAGEEPRPGVERLVHDAWCAELGVPRVPLDVSYFAAGGDSLGAVRLANRLREALGVDVGVDRVLRSPGVRAMAAALDPAGRAPATYQQELMWHRQRQAPNPAAVHMAVRVDLTGPLDVPALTAAVDALVGRHEALRTRVVAGDGGAVQEVLPHRPVAVPVVDLAATDADAAAVRAWCVAVGREPFPADGPWLRARLARLAADRWVLSLVVHHLCGDGWSMLQLLDELARAYAGAPPARVPALRYVEHARRQRAAQVPPEALRHWRETLADLPRAVALPTDRPRPATPSGVGAEYAFTLPAALTGRLARLAADAGLTLFPLLAAAYARFVGALTGTRDVLLACPYAHRDRRELEAVVGLFTGTLPLRVLLRDDEPLADLAARFDAVFLAAVRHQPAPLPALYAAVDPGWRMGDPPPFAGALFTWNPGMPPARLPGLAAEVTDQGLDCARRDWSIMLTPAGDGLLGVVEYSTDLYDESTVAERCRRYVDILVRAAG